MLLLIYTINLFTQFWGKFLFGIDLNVDNIKNNITNYCNK